jgi:hypothetical protein
LCFADLGSASLASITSCRGSVAGSDWDAAAPAAQAGYRPDRGRWVASECLQVRIAPARQASVANETSRNRFVALWRGADGENGPA